MRNIITTIACTVLVTLALMAAVTFYYLMQAPRPYTCQKI
jgi:hypothetical protein